MRLYDILPGDVELAVTRTLQRVIDDRGNLRLTGLDSDGRAIIVVVADDDPDFVITTFPDD
jgi:hypothetical protein